MENMFVRPNKNAPPPVEVNVECDAATTSNGTWTAVLLILKHILYQRQQVPLQVDALQRDANKPTNDALNIQESINSHCDQKTIEQKSHDFNYSTAYSLQLSKESANYRINRTIQAAREKQVKLRQHRLWIQYDKKVGNFIECFHKISKVLENEVKSCAGLHAIRFALGNTIVTAREVYTIHLPAACHTNTLLLTPHTEANIKTALFRSFIMDDVLTSMMSSYCGLQKLWILVLKPQILHASERKGRNSDNGVHLLGNCSLQWLPKPQFKICSVAKLVNVHIENCISVANSCITSLSSPPTSMTQTSETSQQSTRQDAASFQDYLMSSSRGRASRLLPSLTHLPTNAYDHENKECVFIADTSIDPRLSDLDNFDHTPQENSLYATVGTNTNVKNRTPTASNDNSNEMALQSPNNLNKKANLEVNLALLDMVQTPLTSVGHCPSETNNFRSITLNKRTPNSSKRCINGDLTCEKTFPIDMLETPVTKSSDKVISSNFIFKTSLPRQSAEVYKDFSFVPSSQSCSHNDNIFSCDKLTPDPIIETPTASHNRYVTDKNFLTSLHELRTWKKMKVINDVGTPLSEDLPTCMETVPIPMVETPVIPQRKDFSFTKKKCKKKISYESNGKTKCNSTKCIILKRYGNNLFSPHMMDTKQEVNNLYDLFSENNVKQEEIMDDVTLCGPCSQKISLDDTSVQSYSQAASSCNFDGSEYTDMDLMWYQLSLPIVGFKDKPVVRPKASDDPEKSTDFL